MSARATLDTSIGPLTVETDGRQLSRVAWTRLDAPEGMADPLLNEALDQLRAYFDGRLTDFDLPLAPAASPRGGALRDAIRAIPHGEALSYGALARIAQSGPRAIGQACARNPFPVIVPCHRVLAAGGRLGTYTGGDGPATKRRLLEHEGYMFDFKEMM